MFIAIRLPLKRVDYDRPRLVESFGDDHFPREIGEFRNLDQIGAGVRPIKIAGQPVDRNSVWMIDFDVNKSFDDLAQKKHTKIRHSQKSSQIQTTIQKLVIVGP